ncbi:hypothetical protein PFICI_12651 [Pestalotiopsis fici W106-1]|uniref:Uncharacterized protein n=1 Tax=Pestalotiopsis fici (strain W106-1 / CGMCC3.15140) TaxID=1229662 RepID=W3WRE0_PESFW|nr:uncharacterized protein PFICI_12651 [Pestalotiopsis fici W106-1]ETS75707.1 hypothetical protein PFICI_12651 [Pestalotiopsis fici W106-1]
MSGLRRSSSSAATAVASMKKWFPTTSSPLIVSAPMAFVTNVQLATEVTKAGGLGFITGGRDFSPESPALKKLDEDLTTARQSLSLQAKSILHHQEAGAAAGSAGEKDDGVLPIGVGFVTYDASLGAFAQTTTPILRTHRPAAVWLFAPSPRAATTTAEVIASLAAAGREWGLKIVVQVGTVAAAREAARDGAHVIVAQGVDAGGHQWASGAGVISLVPEVVDMLRSEFPDREIAVWAAGGIADGRGVVASLALGAEAAVVGTRFMVAHESSAQDYKRKAILSTSDGGTNTVKSQIHDHVQGNKEWPDLYDGRAIVHHSYHDHQAGVTLEENERRYQAAKESGDHARLVTWSGTGVGLVKQALPAGEMVRTLRNEASQVLQHLKGLTA